VISTVWVPVVVILKSWLSPVVGTIVNAVFRLKPYDQRFPTDRG
jgi:hypothetical protein